MSTEYRTNGDGDVPDVETAERESIMRLARAFLDEAARLPEGSWLAMKWEAAAEESLRRLQEA